MSKKSKREVPVVNMEEISEEMAGMVEYLVRTCGRAPKLQSEAPNQGVVRAVHALLRDEKILARGDALTSIMRLPGLWSHALMEYVNGEKTYQSSPNLRCLIRNDGSATVRIQVGEKRIQKVNHGTATVTDDFDILKIMKNLEPGDERELDARWASHALRANGRYSASVPMWPRRGSAYGAGCLVEVAYTARWTDYDTGEDVLVDSSISAVKESEA